ncbi:MAG: zinc-ribbon domain-containing protein [Verrucomicrobiae bacterium]|nr:zinc-ribbon domain-containing protein [Verrucomicrobiae bacterium]
MKRTETNHAMANHYCPECGSALQEGRRFCEQCGTPIGTPEEGGAESPVSRDPKIETVGGETNRTDVVGPHGGGGSSRGRRVMLALGIVAGLAIVIGLWIVGTWETPEPREPEPLPTSEELFPVKPVGVDSINNTIDGKKVAVEGDGQVMNSPGLGVNRPVWCLNGPTQKRFSVPVGKTEGTGTFTPGLQVLVPELVTLSEDSKVLPIRIRLVGNDGGETVSELQVKPANRWQPLAISFPYDGARAPYRMHFEASGFSGAIYIDRGASSLAGDAPAQP